jgi:hypothetical protein
VIGRRRPSPPARRHRSSPAAGPRLRAPLRSQITTPPGLQIEPPWISTFGREEEARRGAAGEAATTAGGSVGRWIGGGTTVVPWGRSIGGGASAVPRAVDWGRTTTVSRRGSATAVPMLELEGWGRGAVSRRSLAPRTPWRERSRPTHRAAATELGCGTRARWWPANPVVCVSPHPFNVGELGAPDTGESAEASAAPGPVR